MANTTLKNLLSMNRQALRGLHKVAGMDFEKPYTLIERTGNFTLKSVLKELGGNIDDRTHHIFVLYTRVKRWDDGRLYIAKIQDGKFESRRGEIEGYERIRGYRWIDHLIGKSDFEDARKNKDCHYFIIAQEKMDVPEKPPVDMTGRFRVYKEYGNVYITPMWKNCDKYWDNIKRPYSRIEVDKSGYIIDRDQLKRRAENLRRERAANEAARWDNAEAVRKINTQIQALNDRIADMLSGNAPDYGKIARACDKIHWIEGGIHAVKVGKFDSVRSIYAAIARVNKYFDEAENILRGEA